MTLSTQKIGDAAEEKALSYLVSQGLRLIDRNYTCRLGEVDLIMRDNAYLVFVEVRSRTSMIFGGGIASINFAKRQKILKTTSHYMVKHKIFDKYPLRFDVISIDGKSGSITWLKDAFNADSY